MEEVFDDVFLIDKKVATRNLDRGRKVYNETLIEEGRVEYRLWNPYRSKLSAAILKGLKNFEIKKDSCVLYLGAATGTTVSHVSDIASDGRIYAVEFSERNMRELIKVCERRKNILPILEDARYPERYGHNIGEGKCDVMYQDVSSKEQTEILVKNSMFLKKGGYAYFVIKSQSIDISRKPEEVYGDAIREISGKFEVLERIDIEPYDSMHLFTVLRKK
jgi:fibrillarin-like pre-rRNA processing protein